MAARNVSGTTDRSMFGAQVGHSRDASVFIVGRGACSFLTVARIPRALEIYTVLCSSTRKGLRIQDASRSFTLVLICWCTFPTGLLTYTTKASNGPLNIRI
jgi:hypothetical protein